MAKTEFDQTLKLISRNTSLYKLPKSQLDEEVLGELLEEGLIKEDEAKGYCLTGYGEIIEVMGYNSHKKRRKKSGASKEVKWEKHWTIYAIIVLVALTGGFLVLI